MATALGLYNGALLELGAAPLSTITDATKSRYTLDSVYSNVVADCLEQGSWNFALRAVKLEADATLTPAFGWSKVFAKPTDWVRTTMLSGWETFTTPLLEYGEENGILYTWIDPIYLQYVSNSTDFGLNLSLWPRSFTRYVEVTLADRIVTAITQNGGDKDRLQRLTLPKAKRDAMNKDAIGEATKFMPQGSWNNARGFTTRLNGTRRGL